MEVVLSFKCNDVFMSFHKYNQSSPYSQMLCPLYSIFHRATKRGWCVSHELSSHSWYTEALLTDLHAQRTTHGNINTTFRDRISLPLKCVREGNI